MKNLAIILFAGCCFIIGIGCKRKGVDEFIISPNIDTSELKYERVFPPAYENYLDSEDGYHRKKDEIKNEEINSIALIYFYKNGTLVRDGPLFGDNKFLSAFSDALFRDDTLAIDIRRTSSEFGATVVTIKLSDNYFSSHYYEYNDSLDELKHKRIPPIKQTLILDKDPVFEERKVLTG